MFELRQVWLEAEPDEQSEDDEKDEEEEEDDEVVVEPYFPFSNHSCFYLLQDACTNSLLPKKRREKKGTWRGQRGDIVDELVQQLFTWIKN